MRALHRHGVASAIRALLFLRRGSRARRVLPFGRRASPALRVLVLAAVAALATAVPPGAARAEGPPVRRDPWVGYVYPAGGQRGTTVRVTAGGQNLAGVQSALVTGGGVQAKILYHLRGLSQQQLGELRRQLENIRDERVAAATGKAPPKPRPKNDDRINLPDVAPFNRLAELSNEELQDVAAKYLGAPGKRQPNAQIAETVELEVEIDPAAEPGDREVRFRTPQGLSNPLRFQVGTLPEAMEAESFGRPREQTVLEVPVLLNGQVFPGDSDSFRFRARRGQRLVIATEARSLVPFLADAVPGWFQAVVTLRDARGREIAYDDDWRFDPDPVLFFQVPADGEYSVEIHDAIWRGREDFVYRISVSEAPFVTRMFPLGGREGAPREAQIAGWNLADGRLPLDTAPGAGDTRFAVVQRGGRASNPVPYAVDVLPEQDEAEPNDDAVHAEPIRTPTIVNGRIDREGDVDVFVFEGAAGDDVVAEVEGRRLRSPIDSVLRLTDAQGRVLAWNDDFDDGEPGLSTHHADSYVRARLPEAGVWYVRVADVLSHGGPEYGYRLRVGPPRPDFEVVVTPSSLSAVAGRAVPLRAHVIRKDGFDGDVAISLDGAPAGFVLSGARVPAGRSDVRMTLSAPTDGPDEPVALRLVGRATIAGADRSRAAIPAEDEMQAFAYRHLVPSQALVVAVSGGRRAAPVPTPPPTGTVRVPLGGVATTDLMVPGIAWTAARADLAFVLDEPPPGIVIEKWAVVPGGISLTLRAKAGEAKPGPSDNLIVEVFADMPNGRADRGKKGSASDGTRRVSLGYLPAVAVEVVVAR